MLDIVAGYHSIKLQGKLMIQTQEHGKKPDFKPDFIDHLGPNSGRFFSSKIWLLQSLNIMASYYHMQYQKKPMIQS